MSTTIFTDQKAPNGRGIRYHVEARTGLVAEAFSRARCNDEMLEVPNEGGGEPIFVNPDHVASIAPRQESN